MRGRREGGGLGQSFFHISYIYLQPKWVKGRHIQLGGGYVMLSGLKMGADLCHFCSKMSKEN